MPSPSPAAWVHLRTGCKAMAQSHICAGFTEREVPWQGSATGHKTRREDPWAPELASPPASGGTLSSPSPLYVPRPLRAGEAAQSSSLSSPDPDSALPYVYGLIKFPRIPHFF